MNAGIPPATAERFTMKDATLIDRKFDLLAPPDYTLILRAIDAETAYRKAREEYIAAAENARLTVAVCQHCHKPI